MSPDNRTAPDTTSPGDQPALDADPAHRLTVTGLGGAGARLLWGTLTAFHRLGLVEIDGEDDSELYSGTDTTVNVGLFDTDRQTFDRTREHIDDERLATHLSRHTIAPFQGSGGNPERVDRWFDEHPELGNWIRSHLTATTELQSDHAIVYCSLMGGTGSGTIEHVCDVFRDDGWRASDDSREQHVSVVAVAPAFRQGDRPCRQLPGSEREVKTAYVENVIPRLDSLATRVERETVDNVILVSNDLLKLQSFATTADLPFQELRALVEPLRSDLDWSPIRRLYRHEDWVQSATRARANQSLVRALFPLLLGTLQPPDVALDHGFGWGALDATGFAQCLADGFVTPGYCFLQESSAVRQLFPSQVHSTEQATFETALRGATTYSAWTSAAAFCHETVQQALLFAYGRDEIDRSVCSELEQVVSSELDIDTHDVQSVTIDAERDAWFPNGDTPEVAVWTYLVFTDPLPPYAMHLTKEERSHLTTEYGIDIER
ncbi:hypothetical protein [Halorientalis marina]|uniref:hypothetical protein n=1 Tax=Halorientalis marina TaxID=2931976 RepID=UPI001FF3488D|nr:hypothetical protein [Halorientalis marina]